MKVRAPMTLLRSPCWWLLVSARWERIFKIQSDPDVAMATSFRSVDSLCNGSKLGVFPAVLVVDVPTMDCPINGVEKDLCVSNSNGQFGFTNPVDSLIVGCPTMSSDMHCHQSLLK